MEIYLVILFFFFIFSILNPLITNDKKSLGIIIIVECVALLLLSGLRYGVGVDYFSYKELFSCSSDLYEMKEKGFIWAVESFNKLGLSFELFSFVFSSFTILMVFRFILKNSPYVLLSILIYYAFGNFYFASFNTVRQALAVAVFMNTFQYIRDGAFFKYLIVILLVSYFVHTSALILIPLYFFLRREWGNKMKLLILFSACSFTFVTTSLIGMSFYAIYLKFDFFAGKVAPTYYLLGIISLFTFFYSQIYKDWARKNILVLNVNFVSFLLICLSFVFENTPIVMVINRLLGYFTLIYIISLPLLYKDIKYRNNRLFFIVATSCIFSVLCCWALLQNGQDNNMVPYKTIFSKIE